MDTAKTCISVDIGGTFTDIVLQRNRQRSSTKVLTTHQAPERGLLDGVSYLLEREHLSLSDIDVFLHGTTLATNAIIERRGARTALVTTEGFRDTIEIGSESRHDQYDIFLQKPVPLVGRAWRFTVAGRVDARGRILQPFDLEGVVRIAEKLAEGGIESVAVCFLHAYANASHELAARDVLRSRLPQISISLSSEVCPEVREYERASTTCANAYVRPIMAGYLERVEADLHQRGMSCPLLLMTSGGGLTTIQQAADFPIRLVESGPAGGAILAANIAAECGLEEILSFDMGGTTAKICLIDHGKPLKSRTFEVDRTERFLRGSGLPVRIPVIEMVEIGAGGGSIAHVDSLGRVAVGPESASSEPGPAAYGRGGTRPTVSDADLVLGRLDPNRFAGGRLRLHSDLAEAALLNEIGQKLHLGSLTSALAVSEMVEENMANASRVHAAEYGKDLRKRTLVAFGGAAPLHAARLASKLNLSTIVIPLGAGVGSAIGFLQAPIAYEVVRSHHVRLADDELGELESFLAQMEKEARAVVSGAAGASAISLKGTAFMRYVGQGHDLQIDLPDDPMSAVKRPRAFAAALASGFAENYRSIFGRSLDRHPVEVLTWTMTATVAMAPEGPGVAFRSPSGRPEPVGKARLYDFEAGALQDAPIYWRATLPGGFHIDGPAIVAEEETSTVISAGFEMSVHPLGHLILTTKSTPRLSRGDPINEASSSSSTRSGGLAEIDFQIIWSRLIAVVEEQAQALRRTAFSPIVRESGDLSAGFFDSKGRMIAQAITGTPGHVNTMAASVLHFIDRFPLATTECGDVLVTNDPWLGTGHLHDFVVVTPAFHEGRLVGFFASTCHFMDVGGIGFGPDGRDVFEEGFCVPPMHLLRAGVANATLVDLVRANSRYPDEAEGDLMSLAACNDIGGRRLSEMMTEFGLDALEQIGDGIVLRSRAAALAKISELPRGSFSAVMAIDGYEGPVTLRAQLTIDADGLGVDFSGTSGISARGINVPIAYTQAYTAFGLACAIFPHVPNNSGTLSVMRITAPEGCILNAPRPAPVSSRHVVGQMLPDVVFGCLAQVIPDRVLAEGTSSLWNLILEDAHDACLSQGIGATQRFSALSVQTGGTGARSSLDGLNATAFPSGVAGVPVEIIETITPLIFWRKELRDGSGGGGRHTGGLGQIIEIGHRDGHPFYLFAALDRIEHPARGRFGGENGAPGSVRLADGVKLRGKGKQLVPAGGRLIVETPGGGGYGRAQP